MEDLKVTQSRGRDNKSHKCVFFLFFYSQTHEPWELITSTTGLHWDLGPVHGSQTNVQVWDHIRAKNKYVCVSNLSPEFCVPVTLEVENVLEFNSSNSDVVPPLSSSLFFFLDEYAQHCPCRVILVLLCHNIMRERTDKRTEPQPRTRTRF